MATLAAPEQTSGLPPAKSPVWAPILKWALVAAAVILCIYLATQLADKGYGLAVVGVAFVAMAVLVVYGTRRNVPAKYLFPGLILLLGLQAVSYTHLTLPTICSV